MSLNTSPLTDRGSTAGDEAGRSGERLLRPVRAAGFWAAVVLPFLHVPLLATGLGTRAEALAFVGLLACNLVALALGRSYRRG